MIVQHDDRGVLTNIYNDGKSDILKLAEVLGNEATFLEINIFNTLQA